MPDIAVLGLEKRPFELVAATIASIRATINLRALIAKERVGEQRLMRSKRHMVMGDEHYKESKPRLYGYGTVHGRSTISRQLRGTK